MKNIYNFKLLKKMIFYNPKALKGIRAIGI